ncbi:hypothetical protein KSF_087180 [Reticulibacter mediterranei]|uniref:Uncharacterized protein n=1 Tax=Reticulibacter mediterranei TaxID=2778369 RepID=A0A8J3IXL7_9CHLR|nr:hypothetical protein [Reticulibacter mediterranei]GHO98670.1 hypothetical protein KSF_087180 [Reticulibacter mediterranei]
MSQNKEHDPKRRFRIFGGQSAPISTDGKGRQILYRCPSCSKVWLQDGPKPLLDLAAQMLAPLAERLQADLEHLPLMPCRLCLLKLNAGSLEIDAYPESGYGLNYEEPGGRRLQLGIRPVKLLSHPMQGAAEIPTNEQELLALLLWFAGLDSSLSVRLFSQQENEILSREPPAPDRRWKGLSFVLPCPPLRDAVIVMILSALPVEVPLDAQETILLWKLLTALKAAAMIHEQ